MKAVMLGLAVVVVACGVVVAVYAVSAAAWLAVGVLRILVGAS